MMFAPESLLSTEQFLLITDQLAAPADFILHRCLHSWLKDGKDRKCILFSIFGDFNNWKGKLQNADLDKHLKSGSFIFVDLLANTKLPRLQTPGGRVEHGLRPFLDLASSTISEALGLQNNDSDGDADDSNSEVPAPSTSTGKLLIILEDITSLLWLGLSESQLDASRFCRALRALCVRSNAVLMIRHHMLNRSEPDDLFRHLLQLSTVHLEVRPLSSGRSGLVTGEIALHPGPSTVKPRSDAVPRSAAMQYRLTDNSCVFFEKGTVIP